VTAVESATRSVLVVGPACDLTDLIVGRFESGQPPARVSRTDLVGRTDLIAQAVHNVGTLDVLVIDATEQLDVGALDADGAQVASAVGDLAEAFSWCQAVAPGMRDRGDAVVVIVGTVDGYQSESGGSIRSMVQGGLLGLVRGLGVEWAPLAIRVVGVAYSRPVEDEEARTPPIGRHPTPMEVAQTVEFVASKDASYVVAETIRVDGGFIAYQMF
jgi:3-oxoacyl-[acyl-carrier protein] reductase